MSLEPGIPNEASVSSTLRLNPPFRAEHVGSLLRPSALLARRAQFEAKSCTAAELEEAENAAIATAVKLQQSVGIQSITDGEMRRCVLDYRPCYNVVEVCCTEEPFTRVYLRNLSGWRLLLVSPIDPTSASGCH